MTIFEAWIAWVAGESAIQARINAIYPQVLPQASQGTQLPAVCCVVRQVSSRAEAPTLDGGVSDWHQVRLEVTIWEKVVKDAEQVIYMIQGRMKTFNGYLGGGSNVRFSVNGFAGPRSMYDDVTRYYGVQLDILAMLDTSTVS